MTAPSVREALAERISKLVHGLVDQQAMRDEWWEPELAAIIAALAAPPSDSDDAKWRTHFGMAPPSEIPRDDFPFVAAGPRHLNMTENGPRLTTDDIGADVAPKSAVSDPPPAKERMLHEALRRYTINSMGYAADPTMTYCSLCGSRWNQEQEAHKPDCLAAPQEPA